MAHLSLSLPGAAQVGLGGAAITTFESEKVRALLVYLAVEAHQPHRHESLAGLLWPESAEHTARRSLNQALYNLRQVIGDQTATPPYFHIRRDTLQFNTACWPWLASAARRWRSTRPAGVFWPMNWVWSRLWCRKC